MNEYKRTIEAASRHRNILLRMLVRITAYYIFMGFVVALAVNFVPGLAEDFPLGGVAGGSPDPTELSFCRKR